MLCAIRHPRWIAALLSLVVGLGLAPAGARSLQAGNRAGVVVQTGDGRVATTCVRFDEPSITGLELLSRAGVSIVVEVSGLGTAVCAIDGEGCAYPAQPCFCQCQGASCAYWNYLHRVDGAWRYSSISASGYTVTDGAVDAWAWGDKVTPPVYTVDQICAASLAGAPATAVPVALPTAAHMPTFAPAATGVLDSTPNAPATVTPQPTAPVPMAGPTQAAPTTGVPASTVAAPSDTSAAIRAAQDALGSYAFFAIVVIALGGWLIVNSRRKR